jgi:hypothetical protein
VNRRFRSILVLMASLLVFVAAGTAQAPKAGGYYEDEVDIGFKIKSPKGWDFVPSSPMEQNLIGKYTPPRGQFVELGGGARLTPTVWLVKFDRRPKEGEETGYRAPPVENFAAWMKGGRVDHGRAYETDEGKYPKPLKGVKVPAEYYLFEGTSSVGLVGSTPKPVTLYAAVYTLSEEVQVAFLGVGPGGKKWRSYESALSKMAKSFKPIEIDQPESAASGSGTLSLRDRRRAELEKKIATQPGWELYETDSFFVVTSNDDRDFIKELLKRLEAIRGVYEEYYPYKKAQAILAKARAAQESDGEVEDEEEMRTLSTIDPRERSRCSVVRVCKDAQEYATYGGPPGSAGYWYSLEEELVIYDDKAQGGRANTWITLNHEAFHQYIYYFYGNISPHYWYNEGTGDFYSGYEYSHGRFTLKENSWRVRTIQQMIRSEEYAPLEKFVHYTRAEYYERRPGVGPHGLVSGQCYAQGWALIYFMRTGKKKAKGWQDSWDSILGTYLEALVVTEDLDEAVALAFAGVDWEEFEKCWKEYTL